VRFLHRNPPHKNKFFYFGGLTVQKAHLIHPTTPQNDCFMVSSGSMRSKTVAEKA